VIHLTEDLHLGGAARIIQSLVQLASAERLPSAMGGLVANRGFVDSLRAEGVHAGEVGRDLSGLSRLLGTRGPFVAVVHRSGESSSVWDAVVPALRAQGAAILINQNIFSHVDRGATAAHFDLCLFYSRDSMRQHWKGLGCPAVEGYLRRQRVLHCAVQLDPTEEQLLCARHALRAELGIPADAFVMGDTCRPDPRKIDVMGLAVFSKLVRSQPQCYFVTRRYPAIALQLLRGRARQQFRNLPLSSRRDELLATYAAMDVFVHGTSSGESFGMSLGEAMRCGVPVVTNETPGEKHDNAQGELVLEGKTGYLANTPWSMYCRVKQLCLAPDLRRELGCASRARFQAAPYSPASIAAQFEAEVIRIARAKGIDVDRPQTPVSRDPSDLEMRTYLVHHQRAPSVAPLHLPWRASPWNSLVKLERVAWKVTRKALQKAGLALDW
jgi:hypothetical protein